MTDPKVRKENCIRTIVDGVAIWWWWIGGCSTDEGYRDGWRERVGGGVGVLASASLSSLPRIPLWSGTHKRGIGPKQALMSDFRKGVTGDRHFIALSSD